MKISDKGLNLIKKFEGFRSKPYRDAVGVCTVGYGTTYLSHNRPVRCSDKPFSKEKATAILRRQIDEEYAPGVERLLKTDTTQEEFDALVSFAYNVGLGALGRSTLLKKHNAGDKAGAADEFLKWTHAGGRVLRGLVRRRKAERKLYLSSSATKKRSKFPFNIFKIICPKCYGASLS